MDVLRTAASALSAFDPDTADNSRDATLRKAVRLTSQVPMIVAAHSRIRVTGGAGRALTRRSSHAANLLWMLTARSRAPIAAQLIDRDLHFACRARLNASSFAARVVIGTEKPICTRRSLPRHRRVSGTSATAARPRTSMKMAEEIGDPSRAAELREGKRGAGVADHRLRPPCLSRGRPTRAAHARRRRAPVEGNGPAEMVRDPAGSGRGDGALRAPRRKRERRFLFRRRLPPARHQA